MNSCFYCYIPITNTQSKHPIDHPRSIFEFLIFSKVISNIILQAAYIETGVATTRLSTLVCFDCKGAKMFASRVKYRQRPSFQYTAAVPFDHSIRDVFPRLVDFCPVRSRLCALRRKNHSYSIPVCRVDLCPAVYFRVWVLNRSIGRFCKAIADVSTE